MEQDILFILKEINPYVEMNQDSKLLEEQILDSLGILVLISELEAKFGITVPLEGIEIEDFESVSTIIKLVERLI